jgi:hypothetical protein
VFADSPRPVFGAATALSEAATDYRQDNLSLYSLTITQCFNGGFLGHKPYPSPLRDEEKGHFSAAAPLFLIAKA